MKIERDVLYARSQLDGKLIRVTAFFFSDCATNHYLEEHPDEGVLDTVGYYKLIARKDDLGVPFPK